MNVDREAQMLRAAQLYYYDNLTQGAIADRLSCTRWTVGRLLEEARESGVVTIALNHPRARIPKLEKALVKSFGLVDAIVVKRQASVEGTLNLVASMAADYVTEMRPVPRSMGIAWGRTLTAVARAMPESWTYGLEVYQTYGGLTRSNDDVVADSIGLMARRGRGVGHMLPAPAIVSDVDLGRRLRRERSVADTLSAAPCSDVLIFSPGVLEVGSVLVRSGFLTERGLTNYWGYSTLSFFAPEPSYATAESRALDCEGNPVSQELEERTIAISLDSVRKAKISIAVASGVAKAVPLYVALKSKLASVAIIDEELAEAVLEQTECH